jgi:demethylmenaquinone methyltransferase/2-methoxy-6-polyprenyl-1,4-benzoquinol methylase
MAKGRSMTVSSSGQDIYHPAFVKGVFDRCSRRYIAFSYVCSMGFTERWRRQCVAAIPEQTTPPAEIVDLMSGTGEVWPHLLARFPEAGHVTAVDISSGMHAHAIERLHAMRRDNIRFVEADVLSLELPAASADVIVSTFGLKTFNRDQHKQLATAIARTLRPGGTFSLIEASDPRGWIFRPLYRFHLAVLLPLIERLFMRGAQDFAMIATYSRNFGDCRGLAHDLAEEGLEVDYRRYFFGCATGVVGRKPG